MVKSDKNFEVRDYPDLMLVATGSKEDSQGRDGSFMRLFGYISGANESKQAIAMTTPVFMEKGKEEAAGQMGFVVPKQVATDGIPAPTNADVAVRKRTGGRFAVYRFSGRMDRKLAQESEEKLREWMKANGLEADESAAIETAGYDAPFIPGPLRRNEVLIRLKGESEVGK